MNPSFFILNLQSMTLFLILIGIVTLLCVWLNHISARIGVPTLLAFIVLGIVFGNNGLFPIHFEDQEFAKNICTVALIFIMFYGGFGTRWETARQVGVESALMASIGVVLTALFIGVFCHFALGWNWTEGLLMGSVVGSTDAASVFSILRSRKLGLKNNTAPLLEVESGSNDPFSYMLTMVMLSVYQGSASAGSICWMLFAQIVFGAMGGWLIGKGAVWVFQRMRHQSSDFLSLFVFGVAVLAYAIPDLAGGNGYLSAYLAGIIMGNADLRSKRNLVAFFDGVTGLMQVLIFFLLGLLARPAMMHKVILPALAIFAFMLLIARPAAVNAVLTFFKRKKGYGLRQQTLISFVGLRGAASIVFAIMATGGISSDFADTLFNVVFCIVLLSISLQGTLIPFVAKKLDMTDEGDDVMKTFNDYNENSGMQFGRIGIKESSTWNGKKIKDLGLPKNILIAMVLRDGKKLLPNGETCLQAGDMVVIITKSFEDDHTYLEEHTIKSTSSWVGKRLMDYDEPKRGLVVMIRRGEKDFIPNGSSVILEGDVLVICHIDREAEE